MSNNWSCDIAPPVESRAIVNAGHCLVDGNNDLDEITAERLTDPMILKCGPNGSFKSMKCYNASTFQKMAKEPYFKFQSPDGVPLSHQGKQELLKRINIPGRNPFAGINPFNTRIRSPFSHTSSPFGSSPFGSSDWGKSPVIPPDLRNNPLMFAVINDDMTLLRQYLREGHNINIRDKNGNSALMVAIIYKKPRMLSFLISQGIDINSKNFDGMTPLMIAAFANMPNVVKFLIAEGARKNTQDALGRTAYDYARDQRTKKILAPRTRKSSNPKRSRSKKRKSSSPKRGKKRSRSVSPGRSRR